MTSKLRLALPMAVIGVVGAACFLLLQSHASARVTVNYTHLTKYQKRIISETLASALGSAIHGSQIPRRYRQQRRRWRPGRRTVHAAEVVRIAGWRRQSRHGQLLPVVGQLLGKHRK